MHKLSSPPSSRAPVQPRIGRVELVVLISAIMALTAMAIDLMLPGFDEIRETFDLADGSGETGKIITFFFFGLAFAQLVWGPLADRFGRKPVLYASIGIYVIGAVGSAVAPTFDALLASRVVWGVGAAGARVVATAIIRDRFEGTAMAKAMSQVMAVFVLVPVFAPTVGAAILLVLPWRALFWACAVWATLIVIWSFRLRETLNPGNRRELSVGGTWDGFRQVARTPVTFGYTVSTIFIQGVFTSYLASADLIIGEIFDRDAQFPIIFGAVAILFGVGAIGNGRIVERLGIVGVIGRAFAVLLPLSALLLLVAVLGDGVPNFWIFMPLLGLCLSSFMFLMPNLNSGAMDPVGELAGSASALTGAVRIAGGAVIGTIVSAQIDDSVVPFAVAMVVLVTLAAVSVLLVHRDTEAATV
ncbi:MAG: multidrug effflux MFS transporter [Acidimicrobiales bacterium]